MELQGNCHKCNSTNLKAVKSRIGYKLICVDCTAYQQSLNKIHAIEYMRSRTIDLGIACSNCGEVDKWICACYKDYK